MIQSECEARVGSVVRDKWTLVRLLGIGGMAAVYVGVHRIGRHDALKILHPEAAKSKEVCLRFEREAQAVNRFRHAGAVEIRDIDTTEDGAPFLVMELLQGESIDERFQRMHKLPLHEVLILGEQVLDVLASAHQQGIIHRDIKPANLFLTNEGRVKVLDFGLARIHEGGLSDGLHTKEGTMLGTTPYMPPEQAQGHPIDERADIFSVGATMFRLLTGRYLHQAESPFQLLMKQGRDPAPPIRSVAPEVSPTVAMVIDQALAFQRDRRYPSAQAMLEDVRSLRANREPTNAIALGGDLDREAMTRPALPGPGPMPLSYAKLEHTVLGQVPEASALLNPSEDVPVYMSGISEVSAAPASSGPPAAQQNAAPRPVPPPLPRRPESPLERTIVSPTAGTGKKA